MYASLTDIVIEYGPNAYDKFLAIIGDISKSQDQKEREVSALYNKILEKMRQG